MTKRYQTIWHQSFCAERLRDHPKAFEQTIIELQHEMECEARECLRVSQGLSCVRVEDGR